MSKNRVALSDFRNAWYRPGSIGRRVLWYLANIVFVESRFSWSGLRVWFLRMFGARIGNGVVIKPGVRIKHPWMLKVGDYVWLGEDVWVDNLAPVVIEDNVCVSQAAYLLCGNHDYTSREFDLIVKPITLESGVWVGAKAVVCPGTVCHTHAVITAGSVASGELFAYGIYRGNPAQKIRMRSIKSARQCVE